MIKKVQLAAEQVNFQTEQERQKEAQERQTATEQAFLQDRADLRREELRQKEDRATIDRKQKNLEEYI